MSSLFIRFGANAHDIAKRSIYNFGCNYYANRRLLSADAATVTNRQNDSSAASKSEAAVQKLQHFYDADVRGGGVVPAFKRSLLYGNKTAVKDEIGEYTYNQLFNGSKLLAKELSNACGELISIRDKTHTQCNPPNSLFWILQVPEVVLKLRFYAQTQLFIRSFNGLVGFLDKLVSEIARGIA